MGAPGYFAHGNPSTGTPYTVLSSDWANAVQEELVGCITAAGMTPTKGNNAQLLAALKQQFLPRQIVTQNMTYYVSPSGSDNNNGLSAAKPLQNISTAIWYVYRLYDWNGYACTIQLLDGTYNFTGNAQNSYAAIFNGNPFGMNVGALTLNGNVAHPENVVINATTGNCILSTNNAYVIVQNLTATASGTQWNIKSTQGCGFYGANGGWLDVRNIRAVNCSNYCLLTSNNGIITVSAASGASGGVLTLTGSTNAAVYAVMGSYIWAPASSWYISGLAAQTCNFLCDQARMDISGSVFYGAATGQRYYCCNNGVIATAGGGANFLPGSVAGFPAPTASGASTGGQYI